MLCVGLITVRNVLGASSLESQKICCFYELLQKLVMDHAPLKAPKSPRTVRYVQTVLTKALVAPLPVQLLSLVRVAFRPVTALRAGDALRLSPPAGRTKTVDRVAVSV